MMRTTAEHAWEDALVTLLSEDGAQPSSVEEAAVAVTVALAAADEVVARRRTSDDAKKAAAIGPAAASDAAGNANETTNAAARVLFLAAMELLDVETAAAPRPPSARSRAVLLALLGACLEMSPAMVVAAQASQPFVELCTTVHPLLCRHLFTAPPAQLPPPAIKDSEFYDAQGRRTFAAMNAYSAECSRVKQLNLARFDAGPRLLLLDARLPVVVRAVLDTALGAADEEKDGAAAWSLLSTFANCRASHEAACVAFAEQTGRISAFLAGTGTHFRSVRRALCLLIALLRPPGSSMMPEWESEDVQPPPELNMGFEKAGAAWVEFISSPSCPLLAALGVVVARRSGPAARMAACNILLLVFTCGLVVDFGGLAGALGMGVSAPNSARRKISGNTVLAPMLVENLLDAALDEADDCPRLAHAATAALWSLLHPFAASGGGKLPAHLAKVVRMQLAGTVNAVNDAAVLLHPVKRSGGPVVVEGVISPNGQGTIRAVSLSDGRGGSRIPDWGAVPDPTTMYPRLAVNLDDLERGRHRCFMCALRAKSKCGRCLQVHYCGAVCQRNHWKQQHKSTCEGGGKPKAADLG